MPELNGLIRIIERELNIKCLTPEYEILLHLYERGSATPGELLSWHQSASSTFYAALKRLHDNGFVESERDASDRRRSRYWLAERARTVLDEGKSGILALAGEAASMSASSAPAA